jgi:hypothetical protein
MTLRSIITRTATIALTAAALAAPTASARPADAPGVAATQQSSAAVSTYPTRPAQGEQANPRPDATTTAATKPLAERDTNWTTIAIGIAGSLLAVGGIALIGSRTRRTGRARIAA